MVRITFEESHNLADRAIRLCYGEVGIYFIHLKSQAIPYPFAESRLIYIGMSESVQNSIGRRLRDHLSGQSGNVGIRNYTNVRGVGFTFHTLEVLKHCGTSNLFEIESLFLSSFSDAFGSFPVCNGQSGHEIEQLGARKMGVEVDWDNFR